MSRHDRTGRRRLVTMDASTGRAAMTIQDPIARASRAKAFHGRTMTTTSDTHHDIIDMKSDVSTAMIVTVVIIAIKVGGTRGAVTVNAASRAGSMTTATQAATSTSWAESN